MLQSILMKVNGNPLRNASDPLQAHGNNKLALTVELSAGVNSELRASALGQFLGIRVAAVGSF